MGGTPMDASKWARERMAELLPTPMANDAMGGSAAHKLADGTYGSPSLGRLLATPAALLPTPIAQMRGGTNKGGGGKRTTITERPTLEKMLATPTARDWSSGKASAATHAKNSRPLSEQSARLGLDGTAALLALVRWMMGYPPDWLERVRHRASDHSNGE